MRNLILFIRRIIETQDDFHNAVGILFAFIMEHASQHVNHDETDRENKIDLLFDYYLHKLADTLSYRDFQYRVEHFEKLYDGAGRGVFNPFPELEEEIKQDMISIYIQVRNTISILDDGRMDLNLFILWFNMSLKPIIDNDSKGTCPREKELSFGYIFKSFFHH